nr:uncharacterized protein LOC107438037 isoform X1 [Parasteatoda tepidariorum]
MKYYRPEKMFHTPHRSHSHLDADIIKLRRRINDIKEKNIIFRQSLKQNFKDRKKDLKDSELKEKIKCNFLDEEEVSVIEMCHKKTFELVKTDKNMRLNSKKTAKCSTPSSYEVLELEASSISNVNKSLMDHTSIVEKQHTVKEKNQENDLSGSQNEVEVVELFDNSDSILTTPIQNKIRKGKKWSLQCSVVENTFPTTLEINNSIPKPVSNNINQRNISNMQCNSDNPYHSNLLNSSDRNHSKSAAKNLLNSSDRNHSKCAAKNQYHNMPEENLSNVLDSCQQSRLSMSNKNDFVSDENIDQDVIYLSDVSYSSNDRKKKNTILTNENRITFNRKNKTSCRNEGNKKQCKNRKGCVIEPSMSNDVSVISDSSIEENELNVCQTPDIHYLKTIDFSGVITVSDDTDNESNSNVTVSKNVESRVPEISIEVSEEEADHIEDTQSLNEKLEKHSEYIVPSLDFVEEPVDFPVSFLHMQGTLSFSADKIKTWQSQGIFIKSGPFSKQEETLLKRNLRAFQSRFKVYNTRLLLGIGRQLPFFKNESCRIKRFLKAKHFYERLGKDINNRTLHSIYKKARFLFSPFTRRLDKKFAASDKEVIAQIIQLQEKYGKKWILIGQILGLDPAFCANIFSYHKKPFAKGRWSESEIEHLVLAIKNNSKSSDLIENWEKIADLVPSRNAKQCYRFWTSHHMRLKEKCFAS